MLNTKNNIIKMKHLKKFNENSEYYQKYEGELNINISIPPTMIEIAKEFGVSDENMKEVFESYIDHLLGTIYGQEENEFTTWCEDSDNIVDFISEGKTDKAFKSKDSDVKKETFRDKIKDFLKSKGCDISQVGDDFEVHLDTEDILQIMFRNDKMTVKKQGNKFGKDFEYNQLGDVKKELTKIL
jgi:hypothetical protein